MPIALNNTDPLRPLLTYLWAVDDDNVVKELVAGLPTTADVGVLFPNSAPTPSSTAPYGRSFRTGAGAGNYAASANVNFTGAVTNLNQPISVFVVLNRFNGYATNNTADLVGGSGPLLRVNSSGKLGTAAYVGAPAAGTTFTSGSVPNGASTLCITRNNNLPNSVFAYINGVIDPAFVGGLSNANNQFGPVTTVPLGVNCFGGTDNFGWVSADIVYVAIFVGYQLSEADVARLHASLTGGNAFALIAPTQLTFTGPVPDKNGTQGGLFSWGSPALSTYFAGGTAPLAYSLVSGALPSGLALNPVTGLISGSASQSGTFSISVRATDSAAAPASVDSNTFNINIAVPAAPVITVQPVNRVVVEPATATFSVSASGVGLTYQWRRNGADIALANASSYTTPATSVSGGSANSGDSYEVVVSNVGGSVTSNTATLSVNPVGSGLPVISTQPSSQNVTEPQTATFSVVASGIGLVYQWRRNGTNIGAANAASYTTPATSVSGGSANNGDSYDVVVSNTSGSVTSSAATLSVNAVGATPPVITAQPAPQSVTAPQAASFSVVASGVGLSYQWRRNGVAIGGATAASYTTPATSVSGGSANNGDSYSVVVSNSGGSVASNTVALSVSPGVGVAVLTSEPFKNWAGTLLGNTLIEHVVVLRVSDGGLVASFTNLSTNAAGQLVLSGGGLAAGVPVMLATWNSDGSVRGIKAYTPV